MQTFPRSQTLANTETPWCSDQRHHGAAPRQQPAQLLLRGRTVTPGRQPALQPPFKPVTSPPVQTFQLEVRLLSGKPEERKEKQ
jgi:hypothetical protein